MGDLNPPASRRWFQAATWIVLGLVLALPLGYAFWTALQLDRRMEHSLEGADRLRIWAAGMRTGPDTFCGCAPVPKPQRMLYETANSAEIRELVTGIRTAREFNFLGRSETMNCGILTFDFLKDGQMLASLHLKGSTLKSTQREQWRLPLSSGSREALEQWLAARGVRAKADRAQEEFFRSLTTVEPPRTLK